MVAGLNIKVNVWQMSNASDNDVGGAVITGTVSAYDVVARLTPRRPTQQALEAGLEVPRLFDLVVIGNAPAIRERDEVEVSWPKDHSWYQKRLRVIGVQESGQRQRYGPRQFTLSRIERSRSRQ